MVPPAVASPATAEALVFVEPLMVMSRPSVICTLPLAPACVAASDMAAGEPVTVASRLPVMEILAASPARGPLATEEDWTVPAVTAPVTVPVVVSTVIQLVQPVPPARDGVAADRVMAPVPLVPPEVSMLPMEMDGLEVGRPVAPAITVTSPLGEPAPPPPPLVMPWATVIVPAR